MFSNEEITALVEQAREEVRLTTSEGSHGRNPVKWWRLLVGLADVVEQLQDERDALRDTADVWAQRSGKARARVAALEAQAREIVEEIDVWEPYESRDTGSVYLAEAVDECMAVLRALLDSGED